MTKSLVRRRAFRRQQCGNRDEHGLKARRHTILTPLVVLVLAMPVPQALASDGADHFEKQVRPLLIQRCHRCHSGSKAKGGLRLDARDAVLKGGDSGAAIVVGKPDSSLLMKAVRHENGLKMPPDGALTAAQRDALAKWIRDGAIWPDSKEVSTADSVENDDASAVTSPKQPNSDTLAAALQLWLRADSLQLADGDSVPVWPDQSGHGRDVSATKGIRSGGVGGPASFVAKSALLGRPAVRFSPKSGLAASPGNPVEIKGDAALTMTIVMNLSQFEGMHSHTTVFGIGNPAHGGDPGKPLAALIEIDRPQEFSLDFAGGWNHDAVLAPGSFKPYFGKPAIVTIIKTPGPMKETTRFYMNGKLAGPTKNQPLTGRDGVPDIQHRSDIGVFLGKALDWCGGIQGDVGEVLLYNSALSDTDRLGIEIYLGEKFGLWIDEDRMLAPQAVYTDDEKSHWAYQPVREVTPPAVKNDAWVRTPVDRFTLAALESQSLVPPPEVDKRTFLRRVTFDLTGLPPTPEDVDAFLADTSPQAHEAVVDRLLKSPHYGERWGRHWLDLVRYAESTANDANAVTRYAWRYRNYVIDTFNDDLPYDQFLIEQLAGDLLPRTDSVAVNTRRTIATGYLMIGPKALAETDKEQSRLDIVDDQIDVTGRAMLGLTVACARCHDHKFDAIRTTDYYALAGIFRSTEPFQNEVRNATMWWEFSLPQGAGVEPLTVMAPKEALPRNLRVHLRGNRFTLGKTVPRGTLGIVAATSPPPTSPPSSDPSPKTDASSIVDPHQLSSGRLELARWIASPANPLTARVLVNRVWQQHFGRGIVGTPDNFGTRGERPADLALLDWLTMHFIHGDLGIGILPVSTGDSTAKTADRLEVNSTVTSPRLGWSVKQLHRTIVLSSTYRMQSGSRDPALSAFQFHRRRLSAEELRDALLAMSGQLDRTPGGSESGEFLFSKAEDIKALIRPNRVAADDDFYSTFRKRSVYLPIVRNRLPDVLTLFDAADPNGVTAVRNETTVASQGLFLLNHPFVREQSRAFADRLLADPKLSDEQRIDTAHRLAFGRAATPVERDETNAFLLSFMQSPALSDRPEAKRRRAAWQSFCQSLLCSNEFLYVE